MASAVAALVACGGGGSDSTTPTTPTVQGKAVDFYLAGATVTFTDCNNQTVLTGANGDFTFPAGCSSSALKVSGGTDIGTKQPFTGVLQAPAVAYAAGVVPVISPLTTLLAQLGSSQAAALATKLGLQGKNFTTVDPMQDAALIQKAVVVQQLIDQVSKTLAGLSTSTGGSLTPAAASAAAISALAGVVGAASGTVDLTSSALVSSVISAAVQNAKAGFPASVQASIGTVAANVAALAAPVVANQVSNVSTALSIIVLGANPAATLTALQQSGSLNAVIASAQSTTATTLVTAVTAAGLSDATQGTQLAALGSAVVTGNTTAIQNAVSGLPGGYVNQSPVTTVINAVKPANFIQLASMTINGQSFPISNAVTVTGSTLSGIQVAVSQNGDAFAGGSSQVRAAMRYTYGGNEVDLIIENVALTFSNGQLTAAQVPANTTYSFRIAGGISANVTLTNAVADDLFASASSLNLPFTTFLSKLKSAGALSQAQIDSLTPKSGSVFPVTFAVTGQGGKAVNVDALASGVPQAMLTQTVQTGSARLSGYGVTTTVTLNPLNP